MMCRLLPVSRSSFYAWRHHVDADATVRRQLLAAEITRVFGEHHCRYGCRRIAVELNASGWPASVGLVADIMRELG